VAELCIDHKTHFVSASYVSKEMRSLDLKAKEAGVILLQELGLDPGIDRIFFPQSLQIERER
jgi:saccharopine dehydrogenase-like NADP-dependent oxidoreductase